MIPILTPDQMRAVEQAAIDAGTPVEHMMERAADRIASFINHHVIRHEAGARTVLVLAGPGNNGGDALAAAARLAESGWEARAVLVSRSGFDGVPAAQEDLARLQIVDDLGEFDTLDVVLDGIFGNSGRAELTDAAREAIGTSSVYGRRLGAVMIAVDCPSGVDAMTGEADDAAFQADLTLCISHPRRGLLREPAASRVGELVVLDIGLTASDIADAPMHIDAGFVRERLPFRRASAHKSRIGGLLIVGGAPGYFGAPRLAGEAALRAGCGYVGLAVPRSITTAIAAQVPELIFHPTSDGDGRRSAATVREAVNDSERYDALVLGPGLGRDEVADDLLSDLFMPKQPAAAASTSSSVFGIPRRQEVVSETAGGRFESLPRVIDADGLNWLSEQEDWPELLREQRCVLTPHPGEMARLVGSNVDDVLADPWTVALDAARSWGQIVALKHGYTCVACPDGRLLVAPRATPELATPGTGDVLSGVIGAFIAQGLEPEDAAAAAVYAGSMAGRSARSVFGVHSVIARDLIDAIPRTMLDIASGSGPRLRL
jgi:NAD(P)H-hydrate epimerase